MNDLSPIVVSLAALVSGVYDLATGQLGGILGMLGPLLSLKSVNWSNLKSDITALQPADLASLDSQFKAALNINNPVVLAVIQGSADALNQAILLGEALYSNVQTGESIYQTVVALFSGTVQTVEGKMEAKLAIALPPWLQQALAYIQALLPIIGSIIGLFPVA